MRHLSLRAIARQPLILVAAVTAISCELLQLMHLFLLQRHRHGVILNLVKSYELNFTELDPIYDRTMLFDLETLLQRHMIPLPITN
jgi:hypothetical protein